MPNGAVVALDIGILLWLARLDVVQGDALVLSPFHQLATDLLRTVVHPNGIWLAAPFNDLVQAADHTLGGKREIHFDTQPFTVEVVQNIQQSERPTVVQTISHEIHRPNHSYFAGGLPNRLHNAGRFGHGQGE